MDLRILISLLGMGTNWLRAMALLITNTDLAESWRMFTAAFIVLYEPCAKLL
jgi:hypothetical protein